MKMHSINSISVLNKVFCYHYIIHKDIFVLNTNTLLCVLYIKWVAVTQIWCDLAAPQGPTNVGGDLTDNVFRGTLQQGCFEGN